MTMTISSTDRLFDLIENLKSDNLLSLYELENELNIDPLDIVMYPVLLGQDTFFYVGIYIGYNVVSGNLCNATTFEDVVRELSYGIYRANALSDSLYLEYRHVKIYPEFIELGNEALVSLDIKKCNTFHLPSFIPWYSGIKEIMQLDDTEDEIVK